MVIRMFDDKDGTGSFETEIKLETTPAMLADLKAHPLLAAPGQSTRLHTTYHDTVDRRLSAGGAALRVRSSDGGHEQTLKAAGRAGSAFARREWNGTLLSVELDIAALPTEAREHIAALTQDAGLEPQFQVLVDRETRLLTLGDAQIEVAFDDGRVVGGGKETPFAELELELKAGSPAALFHFARQLPLGDALHWSLVTKAARGHALLQSGPAPKAAKAHVVPLDADMTAGGACAAIVWHCLAQFLGHYRRAVMRDGEALHQSRIALRRLRAVLAAFHPILDIDMAKVLRAEYQAVAAATGPARDFDVMIANVERAHDDAMPADLRAELRHYLARRRRNAYVRATKVLDSPALQQLLFDTMLWLEEGAWRQSAAAQQPVVEFAAAILPAQRRKIVKAAHRIAEMTPAERHQVRIRGKKLRYLIEALTGLFPDEDQQARLGIFVDALAQLQSSLGSLNDHETARHAPVLGSARMEPIRRARISAALARLLQTHDGKAAALMAKAEHSLKVLAEARRFWPKKER